MVFPLPEIGGPLLHEIDMREWQDFAPQISIGHDLPDPTRIGLRESGGLLLVSLAPAPGGNPAREYRRPDIELAPGRWLRWRINYRFSPMWSNGFYRQDTLNLAYRATDFTSPPARDIDDRADLF